MKVKVDKVYVSDEILWGHPLAIWEISLQDFDLTSLHNDLNNITWEGNQLQGSLRYNMIEPLPQSLESFKKEFESLKNDIIQQLFDTGNDYIKYNWYRGLEYYKEHTSMKMHLYKDLPGFVMQPHIDNGHIMFQLLLNITDNDIGTAFHSHFNTETAKYNSTPIYSATGEQGKGIVFVNTANSAHSIGNITKDRYILYASIQF